MADRKNAGVIVAVIGIIIVFLGVAGFNIISQTGLTPEQFDSLNSFGNMFGYQSYLSQNDQITLWFAHNRMILLVAGAIVTGAGIFVAVTTPKDGQ